MRHAFIFSSLVSSLILFALAMAGCHSQEHADHHRLHAGPDGPALRHVVLFAWKDGTPEAKVREIESAFAALPGEIDTIRDFEWGTDVSTEGKAQGFTHCFIVTFADEAGLARYGPHPAHQRFVTLIRPHLEKVLVIDFRARGS